MRELIVEKLHDKVGPKLQSINYEIVAGSSPAGTTKLNGEKIEGDMDKILYSSNKTDWGTPQKFFDKLDKEFGFTLDVCALPENAKCKKYFTPDQDGLKQEWNSANWMNPPYGKEIYLWMEKAYNESLKGKTVVCLVPARTDTKWFHDYGIKGEIRFVKGRIKFVGGKHGATFPSLIIVFRGMTAQKDGQ